VCERSRLISIDLDPATDARALKVGMDVTLRLGSPLAAFIEIGFIGVVVRGDAPQMDACLLAGYRIVGEIEGVDVGTARIQARVAGLPKAGPP
jgi:hypothetical protein